MRRDPATFATKGEQITNDSRRAAAGVVASYSISPAPPSGLSFSTTTGVLSGTPLVVAATAQYEVTATNAGGSAMVELTITVNDFPRRD